MIERTDGIFHKLSTTGIFILRMVIESRRVSLVNIAQNANNDCIVLGNGPSLLTSLNSHLELISAKKCLCVNEFVFSDYYARVKPAYYILLDPVYWKRNVSQKWHDWRNRLYNDIKAKTNWPMLLLVPARARSNPALKQFEGTGNVQLFYFNRTPCAGFEPIRHWVYRHNWGMPLAQNVLVAGVFLALNMGYRTVYVLGADHSWHEDIIVDRNNMVCLRDKHFFDADKAKLVPFYRDIHETTTFKMHEICETLGRMFRGYYYVARYAEHLHAHVYNASVKSYIDAFPRRDLHAGRDCAL